MSTKTAVRGKEFTLAYYSVRSTVWPDRGIELYSWQANNVKGKEKRGREKSYEQAEFKARMWSCG